MPRTVGIVTTSFPTHVGDPGGSFVLGLATMLVAQGYRVEVVAPEPDHFVDMRWSAAGEFPLKVFHAPYMRPRRAQGLFYGAGVPDNIAANPRLGFLVPTAMAGLTAAVMRRSTHWDGVISNWLVPSALVCARMRKTHLAIAHSADVHLLRSLPRPLAGALAFAVAGSSRRLGFVSAQLMEEFGDLVPSGIRGRVKRMSSVVPLGVSVEDFETATPREELRSRYGLEGFTALFLGRLIEIKGVDLLIDAAAAKGIALVIAGDGPLRQPLAQRAKALGVPVTFWGVADSSHRRDLLNACDVLVVPSRQLVDGRHEGLPMVIVEGMAARIPVIASDCGASGEVIRNGENGILVPRGNPRALADAMTAVAEDPAFARRLVQGGWETAQGRRMKKVAPLFEGLLWGEERS